MVPGPTGRFEVAGAGGAGVRGFVTPLAETERSSNQRMSFVYIVRCADGTLYTGLARDPQARAAVHNSGKGAKYTRARLPVSLVYSEPCDTLSAALKRERQVKLWRHAMKEALVAGNVTG